MSIPGSGKFSVKDRPERQGRNPGTGEAITIAASKKMSFTAAKRLKDKLQQKHSDDVLSDTGILEIIVYLREF